MSNKPESIGQKSLRAIKWNYLGTIARAFAQIFAQIAMARLLGPDIVGSFGYAILLYGVLGFLIEQGLGWAIVQSNAISERELRIVFARVMLVALLCSAGTFICADLLAAAMGAPAIAQTIRWFAPAYVFAGLLVITHAQLKKDLRFKEMQIAQTVSYVIAYPIAGVLLAAAGAGVASLIVAWILQAALAFTLMWRYAPHSFAMSNPFSRLSLTGYGRDITLINIVNWAVDNAANAFIARFHGPAALGLYNTSLNLVRTPAHHLVVTLQQVIFPTAAAVKGDIALLARLFRTALAVVLFIAIPIFGFAAMASQPIIAVLLGQKWLAAAPLLPPIALAMIPHIVALISGSTLSGRGDQRIELASQIIAATVLVTAFLALPLESVVAVCWLFLGIYLLRAGFLLVMVARRIGFAWSALWPVTRGPALVLLCTFAIFEFAISRAGWPPYVVVSAAGATLLLVQLAAIAALPRFFLDHSVLSILARYAPNSELVRLLLGRAGL